LAYVNPPAKKQKPSTSPIPKPVVYAPEEEIISNEMEDLKVEEVLPTGSLTMDVPLVHGSMARKRIYVDEVTSMADTLGKRLQFIKMVLKDK
jgi:hypothetical protein